MKGHTQERVRRDVVNLQAIASLQLYARDNSLQCCVHHFLPLKAEGSPPDRAGHVKEYPACGGECLFELAAVKIVRNGRPTSRDWVVFQPQRLREKRAIFDQYGAGCNDST